jgi:hypothetical protein
MTHTNHKEMINYSSSKQLCTSFILYMHACILPQGTYIPSNSYTLSLSSHWLERWSSNIFVGTFSLGTWRLNDHLSTIWHHHPQQKNILFWNHRSVSSMMRMFWDYHEHLHQKHWMILPLLIYENSPCNYTLFWF